MRKSLCCPLCNNRRQIQLHRSVTFQQKNMKAFRRFLHRLNLCNRSYQQLLSPIFNLLRLPIAKCRIIIWNNTSDISCTIYITMRNTFNIDIYNPRVNVEFMWRSQWYVACLVRTFVERSAMLGSMRKDPIFGAFQNHVTKNDNSQSNHPFPHCQVLRFTPICNVGLAFAYDRI